MQAALFVKPLGQRKPTASLPNALFFKCHCVLAENPIRKQANNCAQYALIIPQSSDMGHGSISGKSPQLLALNQTLPIWKSIRREMWPDCLVVFISCPGYSHFSHFSHFSCDNQQASKEAYGAIWWSQMGETAREDTHPSESMLFSQTMAFRASVFAEKRERGEKHYTYADRRKGEGERGGGDKK